MASNFQADQGSIKPTFFIGLGGVGSRIVDRIASRANLLPNWESQLDPLTTFVSIDTNESDQHLLKSIPQGNRINIAAFDKAKEIENFKRSDEQQALQWIDPAYKPRTGIKPGAGQIRIESRLCFFHYSKIIKKRLRELVEDMLRPGITWRQNNPAKIDIYIHCTLAGGTGSGNFLSTAYLITDVVNNLGWQPRLVSNLLLSTLVLDKVGSELHTDIHANTYAALKELEHLTKLDYSKIKAMGREEEEFVYFRNEDRNARTSVNHRPFFLSFIFDRPQHLSLPREVDAIADTSFLQAFTPVASDMASELDNYEKNLEDLTHLPGKYRHVSLGYAKNYGACGACALVLPGIDLLEYCILKFSAEAIRSQITFGFDRNSINQDDDRVRALAKVSIDYADPRFLKMSDDDREIAINRSFVSSVQELARQDNKDEIKGGIWQQIVDSTDDGLIKAYDEQGNPIRAETSLETVKRTLHESAEVALNKVSIRDRNLKTLHPESVGQYKEYISRLKEDIRKAKVIIDEELNSLTFAASDGEAIKDLALNPIAERYLVIRLLVQLESDWIPKAEQKLQETEAGDISNSNCRERLEQDNLENLIRASTKTGISLFKKVDEDKFNRVRDAVQVDFSLAVSAAIEYLEAKVYLAQLRALRGYLLKRSRQFLKLSTKMDGVVNELESEAENFRRGINSIEVLPSLRVEVFKTLEEPSIRIWDKVYRSLFTAEGKYIYTFDRTVLSATINNQLKPAVKADGRIVEKNIDEIIQDIKKALRQVGKDRLSLTIFGDSDNTGLNIINGLELEAKLILSRNDPVSIKNVSSDQIEEYRLRKLRALSQLSGVLARVNIAEANSLDDGVIDNNTRLVVSGISGRDTLASDAFMRELKDVLSVGNVQVKEQQWPDPQLLIVHDVITPVPLYYFDPVVGDIESAYLKRSAEKNRSYHLHTDYKWEKTLPNLNPLRSELAVDWTFKLFVKSILTNVIFYKDGCWVLDIAQQSDNIGNSLATATYKLAELYQRDALRKLLDKRINDRVEAMADQEFKEKINKVIGQFNDSLTRFELKDARGEIFQKELLDGPVWSVLKDAAEEIKKSGKSTLNINDDSGYGAFYRIET